MIRMTVSVEILVKRPEKQTRKKTPCASRIFGFSAFSTNQIIPTINTYKSIINILCSKKVAKSNYEVRENELTSDGFS